MRRACLSAALFLLLLSGLACEPIPAPAARNPGPPSGRIEPGDLLPEFLLTDSAGTSVTPATLLGAVTTLTFVVPGAPQPGLFLRRIDDAYDRLGADGARVRRYLVTVPGGGDDLSLVERDGWLSLRGNPEAVTKLAARFGVLTWRESDGEPAQTLGVVVIGPSGVVAARFAGLETWQEMDLVIAITEASR